MNIEERYISLLTDFGFKRLNNRPAALKEKIFTQLFEEAEIAKFSKRELQEYEDSLKAYRDIKNSLESAEEKGRLKGRAEGRVEGRAEGRIEGRAEGRAEGRDERSLEIAREMLRDGESVEKIIRYTGLARQQIEELKAGKE